MLDDQQGARMLPRQFHSKEEMEATHDAERRIFEVTMGAISYESVTKVKMREIAASVAMERGLALADLLSTSKVAPIAHARFMAWKEIYETRGKEGKRLFSLKQIASYFGKDHSSILHGIRRAKEIREREERLKCNN